MTKANIQKFIEIFKTLDPKDKLEIANAIVEELHLSDSFIREDGYDRDLSGMVMPILEDYISKETNKDKLETTKKLVDRFNKLPSNHQSNVIESLEENFESAITREEQFYGYQICQKEGHIFTNWEEKETKWKEFDEAGWCEYYEKYQYLKRKCTRCGKEEIKN